MEEFTATALWPAALAPPFCSLLATQVPPRLNGAAAAAIAVATGRAFNVAWALVSQASAANNPSQVSANTLPIAMRIGRACPTVLVFLTWLVWRFKTARAS